MDYFVKKCLRGLCAALLPVLLLASCSVQEPDASSAVTASALAEANASSSALAARTAGASSDMTAQTAHTAQNARTASAATAQTGNSTQSVPPSASAANGTAPSYAALSPELTVSAQNSQTAKTPAPCTCAYPYSHACAHPYAASLSPARRRPRVNTGWILQIKTTLSASATAPGSIQLLQRAGAPAAYIILLKSWPETANGGRKTPFISGESRR